MKIGLVAPVKLSHPYLENGPAPLLDLHYLRISPWLWFGRRRFSRSVSSGSIPLASYRWRHDLPFLWLEQKAEPSALSVMNASSGFVPLVSMAIEPLGIR